MKRLRNVRLRERLILLLVCCICLMRTMTMKKSTIMDDEKHDAQSHIPHQSLATAVSSQSQVMEKTNNTLDNKDELGRIMEERRRHLHGSCIEMGLTNGTLGPPVSILPRLASRGIFVVCMGHKGGTSSWYRFSDMIAKQDVSFKRRGPLLGIITVRHPLTRLLSAYRDKYLNGQPINNYTFQYKRKTHSGEQWHYRFSAYWLPALISTGRVSSKPLFPAIKEELKHYRPRNRGERVINNAYGNVMEELMARYNHSTFTFEEFLRHVVWTYDLGIPDKHWLPFSTRCQPCTHQYDYVVHLENAGEEIRYLLDLINFPANYTLPAMHHIQSDTQADRLAYEGIPKDLLDKIIKIFLLDFKLFNYTINVR